MKKILTIMALAFITTLFFSCSTDYEGPKPENQPPVINIYDTSDIISSKKTKVQWYGNDIDGATMTYYYTVTTDISLTGANVLDNMPSDGTNDEGGPLWSSTEDNYTYISMPFTHYPNATTPVTIIDTTYADSSFTPEGVFIEEIFVDYKAVKSKFFVYGIDENNKSTAMMEKLFLRTNKIPKHPMIFSTKLQLNGFDKYWMTIGPDSAQLILPEQTSFWQAIDFKWMGEDPDGTDVELEFKWELWERNQLGNNDSIVAKDSEGWSVNNLSKKFSADIYNHNPQGKYSFKVYVRDDAYEESENHATVNFEVFAPELNKGILLIDDTDPELYPPSSSILMGNPDSDSTTVFYESLLRYAGYKPSGEATDSLSLYSIQTFSKGTELAGWDYFMDDHDDDLSTPDVLDSVQIIRAFYNPNIRELSKYRLVIIASDDRSNFNGVDFAGELPYTGYNTYLSSYLDVGGNVMVLGNSVLMGNLYASPNQLPINSYKIPYRQIFDEYAPVVATISNSTKVFFRDYFGIYSMIFPEQKTYITMNVDGSVSPMQFAQDKGVGADNYDFIGVTTYGHIDTMEFKELRIDSNKVKEAWWDKALNATLYQKLSLKDNGTVFTGIPTFEAFKGEAIYNYKSIYDLPFEAGSDTTTVDGDITHPLLWEDNLTGETHPVLRRSGSVATRYIADGDVFKTAFFGLPTYYLDNSNNQVSDMFKNMIDWFKIKDEVVK